MNRTDDIKEILRTKSIAVVGISRDPSKDAHTVPAYLKQKGYRITPVNPSAQEVLGARCFKSLLDIPADIARTIEAVNIFRPSEDIPPIVDQAVELGRRYNNLKGIWMQQGIVNEQAAEKARKAGLRVVQDACIRTEHRSGFR